jgi:RHS repeat-associated protein
LIIDLEGNRVSSTAGGVTTRYLVDMQPPLAQVVAATVGSDVTRYVHTPFGLLSQKDNAGNWEWMLADGLGNIRSVVDNMLTVKEHRHYDPYGNLYAGAMAETPFGFTGEWRDGGTGMYYLRARFYNPANGAFVSQDALETPNRYAYVGGNVVNRVDPSGMQAVCIAGVTCPITPITPGDLPFDFDPPISGVPNWGDALGLELCLWVNSGMCIRPETPEGLESSYLLQLIEGWS